MKGGGSGASQWETGLSTAQPPPHAPAFSQARWEQWLCPEAVVQLQGGQVKTWRELLLRLVARSRTGSREPSVPSLTEVSSALSGHKG